MMLMAREATVAVMVMRNMVTTMVITLVMLTRRSGR